MKNLLGWKWTLGYVVAASLAGCTIVTTLSIGLYLILIVVRLVTSTFWYVVDYYAQMKFGSEVAIVALVGIVGYIILMYLLGYSKKITREVEK